MLRINYKLKFGLIISGMALLMVVAYSCGEKGPEEPEYDRTAMLVNLSDNVIIPAYEKMVSSVGDLEVAVQSFADNPDQNKLANLKTAFEETYKVWQGISPLDFGPGEAESLRGQLNTFPVDADAIEEHVSNGDNNLDVFK